MHPTMQDFVEATPDRERRLSLAAARPADDRVAGRAGDPPRARGRARGRRPARDRRRLDRRVPARDRARRRASSRRTSAPSCASAPSGWRTWHWSRRRRRRRSRPPRSGTAQALVAGVGEARALRRAPRRPRADDGHAGRGARRPVARRRRHCSSWPPILPNEPVALPAAVHAELDLPAAAQRANVFPLAARERAARPADRRRVDAALADPRRGAGRRSVRSVSLALESAALIEQAHRRENEARFASLVRNASDLITVVDRDGRRALPEPVDRADPRVHRRRGLRDPVRGPAHPGGPRAAAARSCRRPATALGSHAFDCTLCPSRRAGAQVRDRRHRPARRRARPRASCSTAATSASAPGFEEQLAHQAFHDTVTGPAEPGAVRRPCRARTRARRPRGHEHRGHLPRPRRLQDDQRQPRPRGRRRGAAAGRPRACSTPSARPTPPRGSAATSSRSCSRTSATRRRRSTSPSASCAVFEMPIAVVGKDLSVRAEHRHRPQRRRRRAGAAATPTS